MKVIACIVSYQIPTWGGKHLVSDILFAASIPYLLIHPGKVLPNEQIKTETPQTATPPSLSVYYLIGSITK